MTHEPIEQPVMNHDDIILVAVEYGQDRRGVWAQLQTWNGEAKHTDRVNLSKATTRAQYSKAVHEALPDVSVADCDHSLMALELSISQHVGNGVNAMDRAAEGFQMFGGDKYATKDGHTYAIGVGPDGSPSFALVMNATAMITGDVVGDDGDGNIERTFSIRITVAHGRTYTCEARAKDFDARNLPALLRAAAGSSFVLEPGMERIVPHAIQSAGAPDEIHERRHTGWLIDADKDWHYLDGTGDLVATDDATDDANAVRVTLPLDPALRPYRMRHDMTPTQGWAALERCLAVGPRALTVPLFAHTYLSILLPFLNTDSRLAVFLLGQTGARKTELAKLAAGAFGTFQGGAGDTFLTWGATYGAWEATGHALKDALYVMDDYKKSVVRDDVVTRFIQHYSTSSGRQRRRADMTALPSTRVRGNVLATGEDAPELESSVQARLVMLSVNPGDVDLDRLTDAQRHADELHGLTVGFARWLAPRADSLLSTLPDLLRDYRATFIARLPADTTNGGRLAENMAALQVAWQTLTSYAEAEGLITPDQGAALAREGHAHIWAAGSAQARNVNAQAPDRVFIDTLQSLLDQGAVMLTRDISEPGGSVGNGAIVGHILRDGSVALFGGESDGGGSIAAYRLVQEHMRRAGTNWPHSWNAVTRYLKQGGWLAAYDSDRATIKRTVAGANRRVVLLHSDALAIPDPL